jgi:hypothetical protein
MKPEMAIEIIYTAAGFLAIATKLSVLICVAIHIKNRGIHCFSTPDLVTLISRSPYIAQRLLDHRKTRLRVCLKSLLTELVSLLYITKVHGSFLEFDTIHCEIPIEICLSSNLITNFIPLLPFHKSTIESNYSSKFKSL